MQVLELLILPPASGLIAIVLGLLFWGRRLGKGLVFAGIVWIYVAATPLFAGWLLAGLESAYPASPTLPAGAQAIVVLAGGRYPDAREYGSETVNAFSLERLRYGAKLHRETGLPLLISGGRVRGDEPSSESQLMVRVLEGELGVTVHWQETESRNTCENAFFSARLLAEAGIEHVLLVSHALHMPRAVWCFQRTELAVTPFPTLAMGDLSRHRGITAFLPQPRALWLTGQALHEYLGLVWYRVKWEVRIGK
ncbi:YdcF family protein [Thioalkalivibrio sulfidiphilus]|uniref:YdcF family protein n=1 Tax=Thioalkalivibrio sulfidiphilus TaxID=1033854 RepID=UPI0003753873|nr:YdcF family protein [Thioalkalivibrio sulfidiphilus]